MAGGLMQLVAYGAQDVYLTGNPQITFFKVVYRRHTNFSMECIELPLNANADFGRRSTVTITRNGDLITKIYLMVTLDKVNLSQGSKFAWVRKLGNALVYDVEVEIGGSKIDRQYGTWLNIWWELARHSGDGERGYLNMIGDVPALTDYNDKTKDEYVMYIPLKFWFNRHVGLALPLIALQYHEVRLNINFRNAEHLYIANANFKANDYRNVSIKDTLLLVDFIYLDSEERRRFAQVGHEYLIEQLQFTGDESVNTAIGRYLLKFNHPTKELVWAMRNGNYGSGQAFPYYTNSDNWENYLNDAALKILEESVLLLNAAICEPDCYDNGHSTLVTPGEQPPSTGTWEDFNAGEAGTTANGNITICNQSSDKALWINTDSLVVASQQTYSLTGKIYAHIVVSPDNVISITNVSTDLTVRDLSFPVSLLLDTRATSDDAFVYQYNNFGTLIDGSVNPVQYALIQLNGHDRFDRREGAYFNYVQPDQHHTNTPVDGINVYSFALNPEQHQPSGTCNLSRIDNTQLNIWFADSTQKSGLPSLNFFNSDNKLYIYAVNYNVLRVMSGMGGLAYSN
jgi:hypothetical protein